ncbi:SAM-dependent methyltransferase [Parasulfuritortus cantonensis]|uniref:SAM-dependent methyltransferase n=1 Tax=Parasulfuritortus cantonensis TaxID=2528202 RepID=A0A4R1B4Z8_9PROT|nr:methyltransferase domain-containing protein [Parasulfuritortus cantonensis]TCJ13194.1 SAM-dependent methyltransferase [Parasulfuritortus cantonensis]
MTENWFDSDVGRYVLEREQAWFDATSADLFGFNALQIGQCHIDFLRANRMPFRFNASVADGTLQARPEELPIAGQSIDLLALPHMLEFSPNPHQLLREVERVLRPEGHLLLAGFNPFGLWGLKRTFGSQRGYPWHGRFLHLTRIKDWLSLLGFELLSGRMVCYAPPVNRAGWLRRFRFMEAAGDRWWALGGGVYLLHAVKRVRGMRLIAPRWEDRWLAKPVWAPPSNRIINHKSR